MCKVVFLRPIWVAVSYFGIQPTLSLTQDNQWHTNAWNMVKAFGTYHNAKYWMLHYKEIQDSSWINMWDSTVNESTKENTNICYFASNELSSEQYSKRFPVTNGITVNVYVNHDLKPLKHMLVGNSLMNSSLRYALRMRRSSHSTFWLIQMPHNATKNTMMYLMNDTGIAYDSNTFCFFYKGNGTIEIYDTYKVISHLPPILKKFATFSPTNGLMVLDPNIWSRRSS